MYLVFEQNFGSKMGEWLFWASEPGFLYSDDTTLQHPKSSDTQQDTKVEISCNGRLVRNAELPR